ncbi:pyridoxamine 5'-phosphate oxidase family protein [Haliea sp. E1-2-M8]|uniref:pyridoxamine 5'-phosphate oxidase family protein n=1 Tax=Haliea sp. E1-2-M8 TaxID=3064706 RepID=UPI002728CB67|nr:pyridoxamine 5'-phosphate oxidase family protein [Haliea sp. E1-2-M8]MDO8863326.1 pyridoxamine 5'-phosphate oxidase family protein [Haliea sp. E1-2-M8]
MPTTLKGPWSRREIEQFLEDSRFPLRLACTSRDGYPRVVSVWYAHVDGALLCVSHRKSALVKLLEQDSRVGFEVSPNAPPYHGVRGQGRVSLAPLGDHDVLETLLDRYLGQQESRVGNWLLARKDEETLITLYPERMFSWDYRQRMADVSAGRAPQ